MSCPLTRHSFLPYLGKDMTPYLGKDLFQALIHYQTQSDDPVSYCGNSCMTRVISLVRSTVFLVASDRIVGLSLKADLDL